MKYTIVITDTAKGHLREIALHIAEESKDRDVAKKFVAELTAACFAFDEFPSGGANPDDRLLRSSGYKFIVHKDYLIFYTVEESDKTIYIQAIFNGKRDYTRFLRKLIK